jgi:hypothetical protein
MHHVKQFVPGGNITAAVKVKIQRITDVLVRGIVLTTVLIKCVVLTGSQHNKIVI